MNLEVDPTGIILGVTAQDLPSVDEDAEDAQTLPKTAASAASMRLAPKREGNSSSSSSIKSVGESDRPSEKISALEGEAGIIVVFAFSTMHDDVDDVDEPLEVLEKFLTRSGLTAAVEEVETPKGFFISTVEME